MRVCVSLGGVIAEDSYSFAKRITFKENPNNFIFICIFSMNMEIATNLDVVKLG